MRHSIRLRAALAFALLAAPPATAQVTTVADLVAAVNDGAPGDVVAIAPGTYALTGPLRPQAGMTLVGAGADQTVITGAAAWDPGTDDLPDNAVDSGSINREAYLVDLGDNTHGVTLAELTLRGPQLHGAITGNDCDDLEVRGVRIEDVLWSGIRTFRMSGARILGNEFVDAGGQYGPTGGALFLTFVVDTEIADNVIRKSPGLERNMFGIKGRKATRVRIHHNTIRTSFAIELPFENDRDVEIDHNVLEGVVSIPKFAGGPVWDEGLSFDIHHNYFTRTYAMEWARNSAEVHHNLFDFDPADDKGNLIANFGAQAAPGPTRFYENRVRNPGRGVFWSEGVYDRIEFANNHVIASTTVTPRTNGLFGFDRANDFSTVAVRDNIIEVSDVARPLMRNDESYGATIENNRFVGLSDSDRYANAETGAPQGPQDAGVFEVGAYGASRVDGWTLGDSPAAPLGQRVSLTADGLGSFVGVARPLGGVLIANRRRVRRWERFDVVDGAAGTVALRSVNNSRYVTVRADSVLVSGGAGAVSVGPAERFTWTSRSDGAACLRSVRTGRYVGVVSAADRRLRADRDACADEARFSWSPLDAAPAFETPVSGTASDAFGLAVSPNPARGTVHIRYTLREAGEASVVVHDVLGRRVAELASGAAAEGSHQVAWATSALAPGTYVVRLVTAGGGAVKRVAVAR